MINSTSHSIVDGHSCELGSLPRVTGPSLRVLGHRDPHRGDHMGTDGTRAGGPLRTQRQAIPLPADNQVRTSLNIDISAQQVPNQIRTPLRSSNALPLDQEVGRFDQFVDIG